MQVLTLCKAGVISISARNGDIEITTRKKSLNDVERIATIQEEGTAPGNQDNILINLETGWILTIENERILIKKGRVNFWSRVFSKQVADIFLIILKWALLIQLIIDSAH